MDIQDQLEKLLCALPKMDQALQGLLLQSKLHIGITLQCFVTPQAANKTIGQGGFQEVEQMNLFKDMVCYQEEVRDPSRVAEVLNRVIEKAIRGSAPAQINIPRDLWTQVIDIELPPIIRIERQAGGIEAIKKAAELLSKLSFQLSYQVQELFYLMQLMIVLN